MDARGQPAVARLGQRLRRRAEAIRRGVTWAIEHRAVYDFLSHPSCLVAMDPEFRAIELICDLVRDAGPKARLVGLDAVAKQVSP